MNNIGSVENSNLAFRSSVRAVSIDNFFDTAGDIYRNRSTNVMYPWTYGDTIKGKKVMTSDVNDCTAGGIVDLDTGEATLFHICPDMPANKYFDAVESYIMSMAGLGKHLRGFIVGSKNMFKDSALMYDNLKSMMTKRDIPVSELRNAKYNETFVMYNGEKDEWLVTNDNINNKIHNGETDSNKILADEFSEVHIADGDKIE